VNLLQNLVIDDVSGVDDPANLLPGWLVQKRAKPADFTKAQRDFQQMLSDIQAKADWSDDQKIEAMQKAIAAVPEAISAPAIKGAVLASRIRETYLEKRHETRDSTGRFAPGPPAHEARPLNPGNVATPEPPAETVVPWIHSGATHEALRDAPLNS
jgi:hypothetical protein